jgi:hypothetical protein
MRTFPSGTEFLKETGASKLVAWTAAGGGANIPHTRQERIVTVLDRYFRSAVAKVTTVAGVEYLQLGDFGTGWRIVNILGEPRAGAPFKLQGSRTGAETTADGLSLDALVEAAVRDYIEGWAKGDEARVRRITHPQWSKKSVRLSHLGAAFLESFGAEKYVQWATSAEHEEWTKSVSREPETGYRRSA